MALESEICSGSAPAIPVGVAILGQGINPTPTATTLEAAPIVSSIPELALLGYCSDKDGEDIALWAALAMLLLESLVAALWKWRPWPRG